MADAAAISLYLDIEEGQYADLEVVAKAALAWNALIKEVIHVVDPSLEVHVDFVSGTRGSASIDNLVRAFNKVAKRHPVRVGILIGIVSTFLLSPVSHLGEDATAYLLAALGHEHGLSDDDIQKIAERVVAMQRNQVAVQHKQEVFKEARRDPRIIGVGVTKEPGVRPPPALIVPKSEFVSMSGGELIRDDTAQTRTEWKMDYPVVIVRAVMKAEERAWRFSHGADEFSATMKDKEFLAALGSGHTGLEIGEGVEIRIDLKIKLERIDGIWTEKERTVERVYTPKPRQGLLEFASH